MDTLQSPSPDRRSCPLQPSIAVRAHLLSSPTKQFRIAKRLPIFNTQERAYSRHLFNEIIKVQRIRRDRVPQRRKENATQGK